MGLIEHLERQSVPLKRPALVDTNTKRTLTYGQLWEQVGRVARGLTEFGLVPGERVVVALPNGIDWAVSVLAILKAGGVVVPMRETASQSEVKRVLTSVKPSHLIVEAYFLNRVLPFDLVSSSGVVVILDRRLKARLRVRRRILRFQELNQVRASSSAAKHGVSTSAAASINFTYRGYGYPLGAILTHDNYIHGVTTYTRTAGLHANQRFLAALPMSHVYPFVGCLLAPLAVGSTVIFVRQPTGQRLWEVMQIYRPTVLTGVPTLYEELLRSRGSHTTSLVVDEAICGGSLMPVRLFEQFRTRWGVALRQGYGLTECLPVTCNPSRGNRPESLGRVVIGVKGVEIHVMGKDRHSLPTGMVGEIAVSGPTVMTGYYGLPQETAAVMRDGRFYTADLGWFDQDGYLHFAGVKKRIAKVAGNMVDLAEVEHVLCSHPVIARARVNTIPDERFGELLEAEVMPRNGGLDALALRRYLRSRLASYKVPRLIRGLQ